MDRMDVPLRFVALGTTDDADLHLRNHHGSRIPSSSELNDLYPWPMHTTICSPTATQQTTKRRNPHVPRGFYIRGLGVLFWNRYVLAIGCSCSTSCEGG